MAGKSYTVIYEPAEESGYCAHIPALDITTEGDARSRYHRSIDYARLLTPSLSSDETSWLKQRLTDA